MRQKIREFKDSLFFVTGILIKNRHVIPHPFELYSDSKEVQLMQTSYVAKESFLGSRFDRLMH